MLRKIFGCLFILMAITFIIGSIVNGDFLKDYGTTAITFGKFAGQLIAVIVYVFSGLFFLTFDKVYQKNYVEGIKKRKKQNVFIIVFTVTYSLLVFMSVIMVATSNTNNYFLTLISLALPYIVPLLIFTVMMGHYTLPYLACSKSFKYNNVMITSYFSAEKEFFSYSEDNTVIASNEIIFFTKTFCIIPIKQIASVEFYNSLEKNIIFWLTSGKKVEVVAGKKQYNSVMSAIQANKHIADC